MLGNSSHKHSEVLPKRGSLTLFVFITLGFKIKTNPPTPPPHPPAAGKCLLTLDTLAINS